MKTALNIAIVIIIFYITANIEDNSTLKSPNYSNSILCSGMLTIFIFIRMYADEFKKHLTNKK